MEVSLSQNYVLLLEENVFQQIPRQYVKLEINSSLDSFLNSSDSNVYNASGKMSIEFLSLSLMQNKILLPDLL